ncbi:hypothetical protein [Pseudomonas sp. NPDC089396]|uniref:hypothetical protein n=1 Tax=Pseudomonas sp. NPDC089396 TaxID=3364461 RepID=UPI00383931FF
MGVGLAISFSGYSTAHGAPAQEPEGVLRLIHFSENGSPKECSLPIPRAYAGETVEYMLNNVGVGAYENVGTCHDIRPHSIQASNIPSSTKILLTDDWLCSKDLDDEYDDEHDWSSNKNFWIELIATRQPSTLEELGINNLFGYPKGGYVTNKGKDTGNLSKGIKVLDYGRMGGDERISEHLSCIRITVGAGPSTPPPAVVQTTLDSQWSAPVRENVDEPYICPDNKVLAGRQHWGDENGPTHHKCATLGAAGTYLRGESRWSSEIIESGIDRDGDDEWYYFSCPRNTVLTGRHHEGDENGPTKYQCSIIYKGATGNPENRLTVVSGEWSAEIQESGKDSKIKGGNEDKGSEFTCPNNQVLIGRAHFGDENDKTRYRCGTLHDPHPSR